MEEGRYGRERCVFISYSRPVHPSSVSLTRASSPEGEAFNLPLRGRGTAAAPEGKALNLPHRGRGTAAAVEEGRCGRERCEKGNHGSPEREARVLIPSRARPVHPSSVSLTRASSPEGEAFNLPLRGRGTAAAVEEGRCGRERCGFDGIAIF